MQPNQTDQQPEVTPSQESGTTPPQNTDDLSSIAKQQSIVQKSKKPLIIGIIAGAVAIGGAVFAVYQWRVQQEIADDKQAVASVVRDFFESARLGQQDRLDSLLAPGKSTVDQQSFRDLAKQIGRECKSEPENASINSGKTRTASLSSTCIPDQSWQFRLAKTTSDGWRIDTVEGSNLVPTIEQASAIDPYINISIYADENKPKPGSCLVSYDAALFNGTSLPRDPFLNFYEDTILFETSSLKYFPAEKAADQFDAFERFYRLTSQRRYHFIITPESYASDNKAPIVKLATERAEAVQESLLKRGIPRARITLQNPVDDTRTKPEQSRGVKLSVQAERACEP